MRRPDDLLGYEELTPMRRVRRVAMIIWLILVGVGIAAFVTWVLGEFGLPTPFELVLGFVGTFSAIWLVARAVDAQPVPTTMRDNPRLAVLRPEPEDGLRQAVRQWDNRLEYAQDDSRHLTHLILPAFADLVDERLRLKYGVIRAADPMRAREIVGPHLWNFLSTPAPQRVTPQQIAALVAQMEEL